jgi:hypothetical protein
MGKPADLEVGDTAGLETCGMSRESLLLAWLAGLEIPAWQIHGREINL